MQVLLVEEQDLLGCERKMLAAIVVCQPGTHASSSDYPDTVGLATGVLTRTTKGSNTTHVEVYDA